MDLRSAVKSIFGGVKNYIASSWKEVGNYNSIFTGFGSDVYANDVVRSCIRAISEGTAKANPKVIRRIENGKIDGDLRLQKMLELRPNLYMNGKDFLAKSRNLYEIYNTLFIYIQRDEFGKCIGLYPMPDASYEALDVNSRLYIKFLFRNGNIQVQPWDDLAVLRKDYNTSDVWGDSNSAILTSLDLLNTTNQGTANAIKSTANLRGILKSTKAMLKPEDIKKQKDQFVTDYLQMENGSGIASLDSTQDFIPVALQPIIANYKHVEELRNNIYRYYGVNENIIMSKATPEEWESFYESRIEPFLIALSQELTYKIYTGRERGYGNEIIFEANRLQYISMASKLNMVQMVDRGALTPNEWREIMNLSPIEGGDVPIRRLDTAPTNMTTEVVDDDNEG